MAFGKKKDDAATPDAELAEDAAEEAVPDADASEPASDAVAAVDEGAPPADKPAGEAAAEPAAPAAPGSDALLSMFAESKNESENDLAVLVDLAGDTDIDDILEELRTLRAALGITDAYDDEEDFAAAA